MVIRFSEGFQSLRLSQHENCVYKSNFVISCLTLKLNFVMRLEEGRGSGGIDNQCDEVVMGPVTW